jgi:putative ATP-dependent endonuclease of OLD family
LKFEGKPLQCGAMDRSGQGSILDGETRTACYLVKIKATAVRCHQTTYVTHAMPENNQPVEIAHLKINNFRGILQGDIQFGRHSVFVGANNVGKTTIIEGLALLFGRDRMVRQLTEHDFHGGCPGPADRILLVATIIGFADDEPADHPAWFRDDRAVVKWWDPTTRTARAVREKPEWHLACQIAFCARFDRPSLEVETLRYFHDDDLVVDPFTEDVVTAVPARLIRELGFFLVPASRTWDKVISFGSELFRRVVASAAGQPADSVIGERDRLRAPEQPLEADPQLAPIVESLNTELQGFFRSKPRLQLRVTATDSDGLLEAVIPHYLQENATLGLPARRHGSGLISLQHLLLLLQFGRQRAAASEGFWMALEEPELHVPPSLQRRLVHRVQALSAQTFVSSHSPIIAAISDPTTVLVLRNDTGILTAERLLDGPLPASAPNAIRKLFQLNRMETISALMHDAILVPEGLIDHDWLRLLVRAVDLGQDWTPATECTFGCHIGVIPTHDAAVAATCSALDRLHPRIAAVVDGDATGIGYAATLAGAAVRPAVVLRWPDGWTMEHVVGWVLEADPAGALAALQQGLVPAAATISGLVTRLADKDRQAHGLKDDRIAYEAVAGVVGELPACRARARELLNGLAASAMGADDPRFTVNPDGSPSVRIFRP